MRIILFIFWIFFSAFIATLPPLSAAGTNPYKTKEILIKFKKTSPGNIKTFLEENGLEIIGIFKRLNTYHCEIISNLSVEKVMDILKNEETIDYAEPNYLYQLDIHPSDPFFVWQWNLDNFGQTAGKPNADIRSIECWDLAIGTSDVVVAVIDSGIDYTHWDLKKNIWINTSEIPNNGIDDDRNGFIDDIYGWDFYHNDNDPMDDTKPFFHGTHIAGIIGAVKDNGIGISGISARVKLMPLKSFSPYGYGYLSDILLAIEYARKNGAQIINASWGSYYYSKVLEEMTKLIGKEGIIIVAAAGNTGENNDISPYYPASFGLENVISVAASDHHDLLASFSNYGKLSVDLVAPGVEILSTAGDNNYQRLSGTSMATPHVTGVLSLILSHNRNFEITTLRNFLFSSADILPSLKEKVFTEGRLNAKRTIELVLIHLQKQPVVTREKNLPKSVKTFLSWYLPNMFSQ